ncbi:hypothetical protein Ahy_B08g092667 [Arachis hypogaea]|uniref:Aminotransferase-like plant mobile domain-containing protein n=1 Tax=Arachis hypogaea TaxID=3818 RepID=A0A444Y4G4_ARAHY|nr:hypothetical protein Ahy_B08g092667 [Arachis hypogaea]
MGQEKRDIVEGMGFGGLAHVPEMNISNTLLIELIDRFDIERGCLKTKQGTINITPRKVAAALGITNNGGNLFPEKVDYNKLNPADKEIFDTIKNISLATLAKNVLEMSVEGEENQKKFKRTFVVFIQKCFLLPTTVSVASPIHKPSIFHMDNLREWDWAKHVLNFLMKGVENKREGKKQSVDGCVFVLMLIYFHETKFPRPFAPDAPPAPWVSYWTKEKIIERISSETTQPLVKKDNVEKRKRALEIIREKRSKKRNDGAQSTNIAPDQFDSPQGQNDFSQTTPTVNIDSEQVSQTQGSSTPSVDAASNTRSPLALSLPSSVQEALMKDIHQEETQQTSNNDPAKEQEQQAQEATVQQESEQEAPVNVCPPEPNKQGVMRSITSSVIEQFFKDADVYQVSNEEQSKEPPVTRQSEKETLILSSFDSAAQPREKEGDKPSFSLGISPPASQPNQPSQESDSQLDILAEAVIEAGVEAALKFGEETSSEPTLPTAQIYKTPQKKKKRKSRTS